MRTGKPMYDRARVHVVRFFADVAGTRTYLTLRTQKNFNAARAWIRSQYGADAAATAVSWGWQ